MVNVVESQFGTTLTTELQLFVEDGDPIRTMTLLFDAVALSSCQMGFSETDLEHFSRLNHLLAAVAKAQRS